MTAISPPSIPTPSRAVEGIVCVEAGMALFVVQDVLIKTMLHTHPIWHLIFARSVMTLLLLTPLMLFLGGRHRILTPFWPLHLIRATLLAFGFTAFYAAFPFMGLAEVTTIFFSAPLITALLAAVVLRETIGPHRIGALALGFVGVVIAMNPGGDSFTLIALLPLGCAFSYAASQIIARRIGERESTLTTGLQTITYMGIMILPLGWLSNQLIDMGPAFHHLRMDWPAELGRDWPAFALLGIAGMAGWMLVTRAYQVANASLVAPFDYTYMPIAVVVGWVYFGEIPKGSTWIGMALIAASGLYLGYRELRAARLGDEPINVAETTFAPGAPMPPPNLDEDGTP